jgi:hypothetical protein
VGGNGEMVSEPVGHRAQLHRWRQTRHKSSHGTACWARWGGGGVQHMGLGVHVGPRYEGKN